MNTKLRIARKHEPVDLDRLATMRQNEVQNLYIRMFGKPLVSGNSEQARRKIAWQIQAEREGGLPESARMRALGIARASRVRINSPAEFRGPVKNAIVTELGSDHDSRLPMPGSVIVKEHRGRTIVVRVLDDGFEYEGAKFPSLSALAKKITGTKWNGYLFFGLTRPSDGR